MNFCSWSSDQGFFLFLSHFAGLDRSISERSFTKESEERMRIGVEYLIGRYKDHLFGHTERGGCPGCGAGYFCPLLSKRYGI